VDEEGLDSESRKDKRIDVDAVQAAAQAVVRYLARPLLIIIWTIGWTLSGLANWGGVLQVDTFTAERYSPHWINWVDTPARRPAARRQL
jgi:hypothetical protein